MARFRQTENTLGFEIGTAASIKNNPYKKNNMLPAGGGGEGALCEAKKTTMSLFSRTALKSEGGRFKTFRRGEERNGGKGRKNEQAIATDRSARTTRTPPKRGKHVPDPV